MNTLRYIPTFLIKCENEITFNEIPFFRGAILHTLGNAPLLFHNHINDTQFRYSYPLIQYKRINGKAAIFCIGDGINEIGNYLSSQDFQITIKNRQIDLVIDKVFSKRHLIQLWNSLFYYRIRNWVALNSKNYQRYKEIENITEQIEFMENILIGNILSFAKGIGISINDSLNCKLISLSKPHLKLAKGVKMMVFDAEFKTNISLPDYIGIGKHASIGFGTIVRNYNK